MPPKVLHVLRGLEIGGMERAVIRLALRGKCEGMDHRLLLFDRPFRSELFDFDPGSSLPTEFIQRRPGIDLRFAGLLARKLTELQPDIVHAHNDTALFYAALGIVLGRVARIALIGTFRTRPAPASAGARILTHWASLRATEITAVSQELGDWLVRSRWVNRCTTIWNGVDLSEFSPKGPSATWRNRLGIPSTATLVGHVGRFASIKRHVDLFDAATMLQTAQPPIYFAFAGDGPLFGTFRKRALKLPNVVMLSNIKDVASFLHNLDIFVLCSEHEGAPQALLEAMACARAIVATRVGGIPHLLDADAPAPAGRLVPPSRPDRLTAEIMRLARDGELRKCLGRLAWERVQSFSFDGEWARYAAVYSAAAENSAMASNR